MVDTTLLNQTIPSQELQGIFYYISAIPKYLTERITEFMISSGFNVTERWVSMLLLFLSLLILYFGIKVAKPIIKIILIIISILLIGGLVIPFW